MTLSLSDLWCRTQNLGYTGGFCLTEENIYQGGNEVWDLEVCIIFCN